MVVFSFGSGSHAWRYPGPSRVGVFQAQAHFFGNQYRQTRWRCPCSIFLATIAETRRLHSGYFPQWPRMVVDDQSSQRFASMSSAMIISACPDLAKLPNTAAIRGMLEIFLSTRDVGSFKARRSCCLVVDEVRRTPNSRDSNCILQDVQLVCPGHGLLQRLITPSFTHRVAWASGISVAQWFRRRCRNGRLPGQCLRCRRRAWNITNRFKPQR